MSGKKTKTEQTQNTAYNNTAQYGWQETPDSSDTKALRNWNPQIDPGLSAQYGRARNDLKGSFLNPTGGYTNAAVRDAQMRTGNERLNEQESNAFRGGQYDVNQQKYGQLSGLAALMAPRLTQTGSSGTGTGSGTSTTSQSGGLLGDILGGVAQVGGAALM